ncbi:UDP-3-O-[3-hydroxymyristoyl] glucosamine N-acyltransferase [Neoasaia chiangmaiensis NBRC 101099]|uniref:UDP-3-O-acylglucosamine N-acyltransferase n=1 Tax=Neoasaia chiangmaiensis TaxID=320497 RepID=A0A1U9KRH9_9PROT|nr:UDP-3-O-(3-hydroxymyristoyl)glucosamine N-acyltransferase [Neoasaia chiangmaiensis]AQS88357.1 UDP-3-O-(3-hydroxymyristoyl)glucosamine N-acyltransferase [Neoasaia chiangmaiensis]GBR39452.1 UDP-3-O-[3-hydroxymyristoyl] glucosamine N-acyltransferase [Neoasaia chiangmaiensis NBRC 101099]GEN14587.1 UDP-3-O-acylglucosamine N-acyltransferase [Neoasaia chiangmaiensis]
MSRDSLPGDPRFFQRLGPFSVQALAEAADAEIVGNGDALRPLKGVAPLQSATAEEVSFLDNRRYLPLLAETRAGAVILGSAFQDKLPPGCVGLVAKTPYLAWARVAALFHPVAPARPGIHPSAIIAENAVIAPDAEIGPLAVIGDRVTIGAGTAIGSHVAIGDGVSIGARCRIGSHASVSHSLIGDRVALYPGVRLGQDGFGFAVGPAGFETVPQLGRVVIGDDVEIGANATIDRGSMRDTVIGAGTRIDNLVQIGHNAQLGRCCIVVSQAGISGSTELGDFVTIAAQAGLIGHIKIGDKARIGAQCGVMSDVDAGADVIGSPAMPFREFFRNVAFLRKMAKRPEKDDS